MIKIAIDPGHGMGNRKPGSYDPGATAGGDTEAAIALEVGLTLAHVLKQRGYGVWMSRDDATDPDYVGTRDDRANAAKCDYFLSLHMNSSDSASATGTETFWRDAEDKPWAQMVQKAALAAWGGRDRGLKTEGQSQHSTLAVLSFVGKACLLEILFMSNATDRAKAKEKARRVAFANALADALDKKHGKQVQ